MTTVLVAAVDVDSIGGPVGIMPMMVAIVAAAPY